jgi:alpha-mannosidase
VIGYRMPVAGDRLSVSAVHRSLLTVSAPNVIVETIKRAEDGNGIIVRCYESQRRRGAVTLTCAFPLARVEKVNLLEEGQETLPAQGNQVTLFVRPYEIVSLRLLCAA